MPPVAVNVTVAPQPFNNYTVEISISPGVGTILSKMITVIPAPAVNSTPASQTVCSGNAINQINITNPNNIAGTTFSWTRTNTANIKGIAANGTGATISGTLTNTTSTPQTTTFTITATANGCSSSTTTATVIVNPLPAVGLTASPLARLLPGQTTTLTSTPGASTGGIITTSWRYNSTPLAVTGNSYVVNVERVGPYQVLIQETWPGNLACANQSSVVTINAGISYKLFIYPSPTQGRFTVSYYNDAGAGSSRTITVYDLKGARIYYAKYDDMRGPYPLLNVDLRPAPPGIYFVVIRDSKGNKLADGKVMIHK